MALSYSQGIGTTPLLGETIGANFDRAVATYPDRDALVSRHQGVRLSYAELGENVDRTAAALAGLGLGKGDRVGIWAPNCAEWVHVQFATAKLGIILVNINPAYRTTELAYALRQSGCKALIAAPDVQDLGLPRDGGGGPRRPPRPRARLLPRRRGPRAAARTRPPRSSGPSSTSTSRSTSSTRAAPPARPRARRSRTTTSSTTASSSASSAATPSRTRSASRCPSTTASGW